MDLGLGFSFWRARVRRGLPGGLGGCMGSADFLMKHLTALPILPVLLLTGLATAAGPESPASPAKKGDRTGNRGPESAELKFKLPPPPVLTPEQALKTFKLAAGFKIQCIASEPMVQAPVAMSWDDQGRLYVCEMRGYMNDVEAAGEDQPLCRVSRLEDTNGDGVMDKSTVFVDKLVMARSVTAFGDGVIVAEPPNLVWYHDTKGAGVADSSEVVATDFGSRGGQPEHMANSLTYCMDNWLWGAGYGQRLRFSKGKFAGEPVRSGGQWGLTQDDWGRRYYNFNSDFLRTDLLPPSVYARNPNLAEKLGLNWRVMQDQTTWPSAPTPGVNRGYNAGQLRPDGTLATCTATCGPVIYRGGLFPAEFAGNAFIPEPSGNLVKRVVLSEAGGVVSGKNAATGTEFLTSTDERFRPVNAYNGPDGGLYLVDMARGVIQHKFFLTHYLVANIKDRQLEQPVNLGRIWRIVPDKAAPQPVKLPKETAAVVAFLDHANGHVRDTAQRVIVERADAGVMDAVKLVATKGRTPQGRVQALWTLEGLGGPTALTPDMLSICLKDASPKVRAAAVRLSGLGNVPDLLTMAGDVDAEVRVQLALQLSAQSSPEAQATVLRILKVGGSPLLNDAIASGGRSHELEYLEQLLKDPAGAEDTLVKSGLARMLAGCVMSERRPARVARLLELVATQPADSPRQLALVQGMAGTEGKGKVQPRKLLYLEAEPAALAALLAKPGKGPGAQVTTAGGEKVSLVSLVDQSLAWPGKPGVPPPPKVVPLTAEEQGRFEKGKVIYAGLCAACHQPGGTGLEGLAPPLLDSEWVLGPVDRPIKIVMHGVGGPLPVAGRTWHLEMPPLPFGDEEIASILTYVRREWEHNASPVSPAEVAKVREASKGRTQAWTAQELNPAAKAGGKKNK